MPRDFLAPYKFELTNMTKGELINCLKSLTKKPYSDKTDLTRFRCDYIKIGKDGVLGEFVYGYFEYGKYGTRRTVLGEYGQETKEIEENESPMDKYFYIFIFQRPYLGYLVLQRIGNVGIRTILNNAINYCGNKKRIKITPVVLGIKELLDNDIVDIIFEIPKIPKLIDEKLRNWINMSHDVKSTIISFKAGKNRSFPESIKKFVFQLLNNIENSDSKNIGYIIDEQETMKITVKVGKNRRTINISSGKVRSWIEVEEEEEIFTKALDLLKDIINEGEDDD